jgi:transposase
MHKRYLVILRHLEGTLNVYIAKMVSLDQHAVGDYIKNYKAKILAGLVMKHGTGTPRKLSEHQEMLKVETVTNKTPDEVSFELRKNWTIEIIRKWVIKNFAITMIHRWMHEVLHRLNLSSTRHIYVLKKADEEKQEEFKITFKVLKKLINGDIEYFLFQD